jgi:hypothetical protein
VVKLFHYFYSIFLLCGHLAFAELPLNVFLDDSSQDADKPFLLFSGWKPPEDRSSPASLSLDCSVFWGALILHTGYLERLYIHGNTTRDAGNNFVPGDNVMRLLVSLFDSPAGFGIKPTTYNLFRNSNTKNRCIEQVAKCYISITMLRALMEEGCSVRCAPNPSPKKGESKQQIVQVKGAEDAEWMDFRIFWDGEQQVGYLSNQAQIIVSALVDEGKYEYEKYLCEQIVLAFVFNVLVSRDDLHTFYNEVHAKIAKINNFKNLPSTQDYSAAFNKAIRSLEQAIKEASGLDAAVAGFKLLVSPKNFHEIQAMLLKTKDQAQILSEVNKRKRAKPDLCRIDAMKAKVRRDFFAPHVEHLDDRLAAMMFEDLCRIAKPLIAAAMYPDTPVQNNFCSRLSFLADQPPVVLSPNRPFQDCVETSIRHFFNLCLGQRMIDHFSSSPDSTGQELVEQLRRAIAEYCAKAREGHVLATRTETDRIQELVAFFRKYWRDVNNGEIEARTAWNSVVFHLDGVAYRDGDTGNEIQSGYTSIVNAICGVLGLPIPDAANRNAAMAEILKIFSAWRPDKVVITCPEQLAVGTETGIVRFLVNDNEYFALNVGRGHSVVDLPGTDYVDYNTRYHGMNIHWSFLGSFFASPRSPFCDSRSVYQQMFGLACRVCQSPVIQRFLACAPKSTERDMWFSVLSNIVRSYGGKLVITRPVGSDLNLTEFETVEKVVLSRGGISGNRRHPHSSLNGQRTFRGIWSTGKKSRSVKML